MIKNHVDQEVGDGQESGIVRNRGARLGVSLTTDSLKSSNLKKKNLVGTIDCGITPIPCHFTPPLL